jgi:polygalacturonase
MRTHLKSFVIFHSILILTFVSSHVMSQSTNKPWTSVNEPMAEMANIRKQIKAPQFPAKQLVVTEYGAVGDGKTLNTEAFKKAIEACNKQGGGMVVVPKGTFLTGAIHLKSNVNLHLVDSARINFSTNPKDYPIVFTRWEGMELMNYSALIYAYEQENIAITGNGTLDGQANETTWWAWNIKATGKPSLQVNARDRLHAQNHKQIDARQRVYGEGDFLRPNFIQFYKCKNILISEIKLIDSPMWNVNPVLSENITIDHIKIISHGTNTDGVNPESCKNVLISNCYFDTGDDCIAIKSGRDEDGRKIAKPAENHIIENSIMKDGHGGVVIGSEISGGARNIFAINCKMDSPNLERGLRLKTSSSRGGTIENIFMKDIEVGTYRDELISVNMFYEQPGEFMPVIRNIWVENVNVKKGGNIGIYIRAYKESPVENLRIVNCNFLGVKTPMQIDYAKNLELSNVYINEQLAKAPAQQ